MREEAGVSTTPVRLHTHEWNPAGRRRALLVHGLASDGATMWRLADALADAGVHVVAPDLRGHGASPPTATYPLAGYVADVARLGRGWDLVAGHSLGGSVLVELLGRPGFARAAVLIDPVLTIPDETVDDLVAGLRADVAGRASVASVLDEEPGWDREDVLRTVAAARTVTDRVVEESIRGNLPWDLTDRPAGWRADVRVLVAGDDSLLGRGGLAALGGSDVTIVTGSGHSVHRDQPRVVVDALRDALDGRRG